MIIAPRLTVRIPCLACIAFAVYVAGMWALIVWGALQLIGG